MSDQIITNAMLRAQDLARIAELEHRTLWLEERISDVSSRHLSARTRIEELEEMLEWARDAMQEYQIAGTADITRLLAKGSDAERGAK